MKVKHYLTLHWFMLFLSYTILMESHISLHKVCLCIPCHKQFLDNCAKIFVVQINLKLTFNLNKQDDKEVIFLMYLR